MVRDRFFTGVAGEITLYERPDFQGRYAVASGDMSIVASEGFRDAAPSIVVRDGIWEVCTDAYFRGRCAELAPGNYPGIEGLTEGVSSARQVGYPVYGALDVYRR